VSSEPGTLDLDSVPRLAQGVRLRRDRISGKLFLLRPEAGFELQGSAAAVVALCDARLTVAEIVDRLVTTHRGATRTRIADEVAQLLRDLAARGLVEVRRPS
jgi:pyrroloquinoline quinone biosynthesis protein D